MSLPELSLQIVYGHAAWIIILATVLLAVLPASLTRARRTLAALFGVAVVLAVLPGKAAASYWLGLVFQWPSTLLVGLCLVKLCFAWQGKPDTAAMPPALAAALGLVGSLLYVDAIGLISLSLYYRGFGPYGAPLLALLLAAGASLAVLRGYARPQGLAILGAVVAFSTLRLPTGNLWDALLDPLLWGWALCTLVRQLWRWLRTHSTAVPAAT